MDSPCVLISLSNTSNEKTKYMVLFHLFFLLSSTIPPKVMVLIDLFLLFARDHSTINTWSSSVYSFFCKRPFDQNILSYFIYFLLCTTIRPKIMVLIDVFHLFAYDHSTKIYGPLSFILSFVHENSTIDYGPH